MKIFEQLLILYKLIKCLDTAKTQNKSTLGHSGSDKLQDNSIRYNREYPNQSNPFEKNKSSIKNISKINSIATKSSIIYIIAMS
jgi:hypothetical protein